MEMTIQTRCQSSPSLFSVTMTQLYFYGLGIIHRCAAWAFSHDHTVSRAVRRGLGTTFKSFREPSLDGCKSSEDGDDGVLWQSQYLLTVFVTDSLPWHFPHVINQMGMETIWCSMQRYKIGAGPKHTQDTIFGWSSERTWKADEDLIKTGGVWCE